MRACLWPQARSSSPDETIDNTPMEQPMRQTKAHLIILTILLGLASGEARGASSSRVILPLVPGWYKGSQVLYIQTEASDPSVAQEQNVNFVPRLGGAAGSNTVDDIYVFNNYQQANVLPSAPNPLGPENADADYTPLWQVDLVTWNEGETPELLTSETAINDAATNGKLTINKTGLIVNCPVVFSPQGGTLPTATIIGEPDQKHVILPLVTCWYKGAQILYLQTEASDRTVAQDQNVNYVPRLAGAADTDTVDDIYVVSNFQQANVIPSAPHPLGPENDDPDYTPLWQVSVVTWNQGETPYLLTSEAAVDDAAIGGKLTINKTGIIVNCPIIASALPTARIIGTQAALGPLSLLPGGAVQVALSGQAGQSYPIQASTNLLDWLSITNVTLTNSSAQFVDPFGTTWPQRFYRAVDQ